MPAMSEAQKRNLLWVDSFVALAKGSRFFRVACRNDKGAKYVTTNIPITGRPKHFL